MTERLFINSEVAHAYRPSKMRMKNGKMVECEPYKSGISKTDAGTWIHMLSFKGIILGGYILPVLELKRRIKELKSEGKVKIVWGGDLKASKLFLVKTKDLFDYSPKNLTDCFVYHESRQPFLV